MNTTRRIEEAPGPYPFRTEGQCSRKGCALWNDDLDTCGLSAVSLHLLVKTAITDAAVEIMRTMGDDRR